MDGDIQHGAANTAKGADVQVQLGVGQNLSGYALFYLRGPNCSTVRERELRHRNMIQWHHLA